MSVKPVPKIGSGDALFRSLFHMGWAGSEYLVRPVNGKRK